MLRKYKDIYFYIQIPRRELHCLTILTRTFYNGIKNLVFSSLGKRKLHYKDKSVNFVCLEIIVVYPDIKCTVWEKFRVCEYLRWYT